MKKLYLLSLLLPLWTLLPLWGPGGCLFAAVQVKNISTDYANKRVTFNLAWAAGTRNATHLSKVWVLVDYQEVTNPNTTGAWQRATVNLSALPAGGTADGSNARGFWYQGQATAAQSTTITITLTNVPAKFNWCAYATDYPPQAIYNNGSYTFKGTPPFTITATDNVSQQIVNGETIAQSALTITPMTLTDATNCPNTFCVIAYDDCPVIYACRDLPNDTYSSVALANSACEAMLGTGWRMPTIAELSCKWATLNTDTNNSFERYWYLTTSGCYLGYCGCYKNGSCASYLPSFDYFNATNPLPGYRCVHSK